MNSGRLTIRREEFYSSDPFRDGYLSVVRPAEQRGRPIPDQKFIRKPVRDPQEALRKIGTMLAETIRKQNESRRLTGVLWGKYLLECARRGIEPEKV